MIEIYSDGCSKGNPGQAAWAFVILRDGVEVVRDSGYLGDHETNNKAEHFALWHALQYVRLAELKDDVFWIVSDSQLLIRQIRGEYQVRSDNLKEIHQSIMSVATLLFNGKESHVEWRPRTDPWIQVCDALCNEVIDRRNC